MTRRRAGKSSAMASLLVVLVMGVGCGDAARVGSEVGGEWRGRTTAMGGYELFRVAGDTLVHGYFEGDGTGDLRRYRIEAAEAGQLRLVEEGSGFIRHVRYEIEGDVLRVAFSEGGSPGTFYRAGSEALQRAEREVGL